MRFSDQKTEEATFLIKNINVLKKVITSGIKKHHAALILCCLGLFIYGYFLIYKYIHFSYDDWDLAFINQSIWNMTHGRLQSSLFGFHPLGDHATFIHFLIAPLLILIPHPLTYSFLQLILFIFSAFLFYLISYHYIGKLSAFLITLAYLVFLPNLLALLSDPSPEALTPFFFFLIIYAFHKKNIRVFYITILFFLLLKENAALMVMMLSLWGLCAKDRDRFLWGVIPFFLSFFFFLVVVKYIVPYFRGVENHHHWVRYAHLGDTPKEVLLSLSKLSTWRNSVFNSLNINYIRSLFGVFLSPALLSPLGLLPAGPMIFYHMLSNKAAEKSIYYFYNLMLTPAIFYASLQTVRRFKNSPVMRIWLCGFLLLGCVVQIYSYIDAIEHKIGLTSRDASKYWRLLRQIPSNAAVVATFDFLPALSLREHLYSFHKIYNKEFQDLELMKTSDFNVGYVFVLPKNVDYAIINNDKIFLTSNLSNIVEDSKYAREKILLFKQKWTEIDSEGPVKLYRKKPK